jgi:hypothetical protein
VNAYKRLEVVAYRGVGKKNKEIGYQRDTRSKVLQGETGILSMFYFGISMISRIDFPSHIHIMMISCFCLKVISFLPPLRAYLPHEDCVLLWYTFKGVLETLSAYEVQWFFRTYLFPAYDDYAEI